MTAETEALRAEIERLRAERDALRGALQDMMTRYGPDHSTMQSTPWDRARAALSKVRP